MTSTAQDCNFSLPDQIDQGCELPNPGENAMLLKAVLVAAMTMSAPQAPTLPLEANPVSVFDSNAPTTACASEAVGAEIESSGASSCAAAQANYDAVYEEYWWAYNNLTTAVQVYAACTENCGS